MMTADRLGAALVEVNTIERQGRADMRDLALDAEDRRHAEIVMRQALGLRRALENWLAARACRAAQQSV
jgi:hypothetical protein